MNYIEYIKKLFCNCFKSNKVENKTDDIIFNTDEGDLLFYSCFEDSS